MVLSSRKLRIEDFDWGDLRRLQQITSKSSQCYETSPPYISTFSYWSTIFPTQSSLVSHIWSRGTSSDLHQGKMPTDRKLSMIDRLWNHQVGSSTSNASMQKNLFWAALVGSLYLLKPIRVNPGGFKRKKNVQGSLEKNFLAREWFSLGKRDWTVRLGFQKTVPSYSVLRLSTIWLQDYKSTVLQYYPTLLQSTHTLHVCKLRINTKNISHLNINNTGTNKKTKHLQGEQWGLGKNSAILEKAHHPLVN